MSDAMISAKSPDLGAEMIGPFMDQMNGGTCPYALPILGGVGLSAAAWAAIDWTQATSNAAAALALAGLVGGGIVGGIVYAVNKYDQVKLARLKLYEDANKASLSKQIEDMTAQAKAANDATIVNQERMRDSLHQLRQDAQRASLENHELRDDLATLRQQFMEVSNRLHAVNLELHAANAKMRVTADALQVSERDREALRLHREDLLAHLKGLKHGQQVQAQQVAALATTVSSDNLPSLSKVIAANTGATAEKTAEIARDIKELKGGQP